MPPSRLQQGAGRGLARWMITVAIAAAGCATPEASDRGLPRPSPLELPPLAPRVVSTPDPTPRPPSVRLLDSTRFTLEVLDADLRSVLLGLSRGGPLNVVVDPGVQGRVTADLRDASLLEILREFVVARGYSYEIEGRTLRVRASDRETRVYRVDYPDYTRSGRSELELAGFIGTSPAVVESGGDDGAQDTSLSSLTTVQATDVWSEVEAAVRAIVFDAGESSEVDGPTSLGTPGRVVASRQAGLLTVTASLATLFDVERYLAEVGASLDRQVLIDAHFIEVTLGDELDFGIDAEIAPDMESVAGVFARSIVPGLPPAAFDQALAPILSEGGGQFGIVDDDFGLILRALAKQTDVRVVSTPSITTLSNHKALIKVVRNEVFFVAEVETVITDTVVQQTTEFTPKIVPVGVTLDVTPHVAADDWITLHVRPSVSEVVAVTPQPTSDPDLPQTGSLPVVDLRETDSVLSVEDGTTIVIGGLVRSKQLEQERRIPLLGDIPVLGTLFKRIETEEARTELLIFLRPTLLDPPRIARVAREREQSMKRQEELLQSRAQPRPWWREPLDASAGEEQP